MDEEAKEDVDGCCGFRLTPQMDFGNAFRSSDLGLSSLSPSWRMPDSEGAVRFFVESTWEECEGVLE